MLHDGLARLSAEKAAVKGGHCNEMFADRGHDRSSASCSLKVSSIWGAGGRRRTSDLGRSTTKAVFGSKDSSLPLALVLPGCEAGREDCRSGRPSFLLPGREDEREDGLPSLFSLPSSCVDGSCPPAQAHPSAP